MKDYAVEIIQRELDSGERLLWAGRPKPGWSLRPADAFMVPFSLLWGGFAIFWETSVLIMTDGANDPIALVFPLLGIPFVLVGLYLIVGRFAVDSWRRRKTYYGLTDQRAIIVSGLFSRSVKSLNLGNVSDLSLVEKADKSGSIAFGQENPMMHLMGWSVLLGLSGSPVPKFELIPGAKDVYNLLRAQKGR